jgi:hypothetical protein
VKNNAPTVKKISNMFITVNLPCRFQTWRWWAFALRGLLFGFWITRVNPGFVSCYDPRDEVLVVMTPSVRGTQTYTTNLNIFHIFSALDITKSKNKHL